VQLRSNIPSNRGGGKCRPLTTIPVAQSGVGVYICPILVRKSGVLHRGEIFSSAHENMSRLTVMYLIFISIMKIRGCRLLPLNSRQLPHNGALTQDRCTEMRRHTSYFWRLIMLGLIARWGHNVLLAAMGLLTIGIVVLVA
jgi:hypothetical protein